LLLDPAALVRAIKADTLSIVGACVALAAGYVVMLRLTGGRFQRR